LVIIWFLCLGYWSLGHAVDGISLNPAQTIFSARQLGMGGVGVAFSGDANGVFTNPAGLANASFPQISASSRKLLMNETQYTLLDWAMPTNWGTFGIGYTSMNTGGSLPTKLDPATGRIVIDPTREATSYDNNVIAISYSRKVRPNLSLGTNVKFFNQSLSGDVSSRAQATGIDLCALYQARKWLTLGANLQNVVEGNLAWKGSTSDKIGGFYKLGAKVNLLGASSEALRTNSQQLYVGVDYDMPHSTLASSNYHIGLEYLPIDKVAVRTGYNQAGFTLGVGIINEGFRFDYAFVSNPEIPGDNPHYFSLSYIGERVLDVSYTLKEKESGIIFIQPENRTITSEESIVVSAEARAKIILDQKKRWIVTAISETQEVTEIIEYENLKPVYLNGQEVYQSGIIDVSAPLTLGRNVLQLVGYATVEGLVKNVSPETLMMSSEVVVLRFDPFPDTPMDYWAIRPIALGITLGVIKGYPDDTFKPDKGITRAELVTLLVRTIGVPTDQELDSMSFKDVPANNWAAKYIDFAVEEGLVMGYPNNTFKPNKVVTRAEGVTIIARYATLALKEVDEVPFPDLVADYWANKYIVAALEAGIIKYLEGKNFEPNAPLTRAEACEVLYWTPQIQRRVNQFWETGFVSPYQEGTPADVPPTTTISTPEAIATPPSTQEAVETPSTTPEATETPTPEAH